MTEDVPWWAGAAELGVVLIALVLAIAAGVVLPKLRSWLAAKGVLTVIMQDVALAEKMDEGVLNIIRAAALRTRDAIPGEHPDVDRLVQDALPVVYRDFSGTIEHFGKENEMKEYVLARVPEALDRIPIPRPKPRRDPLQEGLR